jgi:hypothetical protein
VESSDAPRRDIRAGAVVSEVFSIYRDNAAALIGSAAAVFIVVGLVAGLLQSTDSFVLALIGAGVRIAGHALYTGFVVNLVRDVRDGRRDEAVGDLFSAAAPTILPLIGFGILFAIGVTIGFVLLIVPGLILITFWSVGAPAIVVERAGVIEAFGRSWRLVRGNAWSVFATLLLVLLIVIAIGIVLGVVATPIGDGAIVVASILSGILTAPIFSLAVSVLYFELGGGRDAAGETAPAAAPPPPAA